MKKRVESWNKSKFFFDLVIRVGDRQRHGSSQSDNQRAKSCDSSHSGSSGRHLTGEMIRQLQEQTKDTRIPPPPPPPANTQQQQHLLDINASAALYEKVLQVRFILKSLHCTRIS